MANLLIYMKTKAYDYTYAIISIIGYIVFIIAFAVGMVKFINKILF